MTITESSPVARLFALVRTPELWRTVADFAAILLAFTLPWSTTLVAVFAVLMLIAMVPFFDIEAFMRALRHPISWVPIALFVLAAVGTLWSTATWGERLYAVGPTVKFLMLPFLIYHFERSKRGLSIFVAFLISCVLLALMSWIVAYHPQLTLKAAGQDSRGIFVKNYIDQSQEFTLCAAALVYPALEFFRARRAGIVLLLCALAAGLLATMTFVIVSRTALVTTPIMLVAAGMVHLRWRNNLAIFCGVIAVGGLAWIVSSQLEQTVATFVTQYEVYSESGTATSVGERLEYWKKSLRFFAEAPLIGHGTGATRGLFEQAATGSRDLASARIIGNPHNQTLNVAVQWGIMGVALLYAIWLTHLLAFRGETLADWIGLLVVMQNILTSLFNSHLFDFHEGWMYVLGVGVAGGMIRKAYSATEVTRTAVPEEGALAGAGEIGYQRART
jgi:O-antigen ligase